MKEVLIVGIIFAGILLALAIIPGTILIAIKMLKGGFSRTNQKQQSDEARMIQEIYRGFSRMEERVDALETILFDRDREDTKK
jgi:phage shock protein B